MKSIYIVAEGQTECNFVKRVLSPYFAGRSILIPITVITGTDRKRGRVFKGGVLKYAQIRNTVSNTICMAKKNGAFVSSMFDYYGLPFDTPGMAGTAAFSDPLDKVHFLEQSIRDNEEYRYFTPYIQLHEFESLIFSDLTKLEKEYFEPEYDLHKLYECLEQYNGNPELIDNSPETAPSKRILSCIPDYDKVNRGVSAAEEIGMETMMEKCPHFREWIDTLSDFAGS